MSFLQAAQRLQSWGFEVFPLTPNGKISVVEDFEHVASKDFLKSQMFWRDPVMGWEQPYNIGISTSRFRLGERLIVIDVDDKDGKNGSEQLLKWELEGKELPKTFTQKTPSGGRHLVYRTTRLVGNSASRIAPGIDIRAHGGLIVGAGSIIDDVEYTADWDAVAEAPEWLINLCGEQVQKEDRNELEEQAELRAKRYLLSNAPLAISGQGGNQTTYVVACRLKDLGVDKSFALGLMSEFWNNRCEPPWSLEELKTIVDNAYFYGRDKLGSKTPEVAFTPLVDEKAVDPIDKLNEQYAFVIAGGGHHILYETKDDKGFDKIEHLFEATYHAKFASEKISIGDGKLVPVTKLWMSSRKRRSYDGFCFRPGLPAPRGYYNLFRGFTIQPSKERTPELVKPLDQFLLHIRENICDGNEEHFNWVVGWFAHLFQKPYEKPLVALVLRGTKGTGKSAICNRIGYLLGNHYLATADNRYLTSNFNGHLENLLMFVLEEATWGGDKKADGTLKHLITGETHFIEHKGKESYSVDNRCRVVIIGNEDWLVPASEDERRYAVFNVGDGRKQDRNFFRSMREGFEAGGYAVLLDYLLNFDLSKIDLNEAPKTQGLVDQQLASQDPIEQWWYQSLVDGEVYGAPFEEWPEEMTKADLRNALIAFYKSRQINSRLPHEVAFTKALKRVSYGGVAPSRARVEGSRKQTFKFLSLEEARKQYEQRLKTQLEWM